MALFVIYFVFIAVYIFICMYYVIERLISLDKQGNSAKSKHILMLSSFCVAGEWVSAVSGQKNQKNSHPKLF